MIATALLGAMVFVACWVGVLWFGFGETGPAWLVPVLFMAGVAGAAWFVIGMALALLGVGPELHVEWSWR